MLSTKEIIKQDVKQYCKSKEDALCYAKDWLKNTNASKAKKQELQHAVEEIKWILEAAEELPNELDQFMNLKK